VGCSGSPWNSSSAVLADTASPGPSCAPDAVVRRTAARITAHGSASPNGMSVDSTTGTSAASSEPSRHS
jgi:hypothetical protein